jgi:hypothetical protein
MVNGRSRLASIGEQSVIGNSVEFFEQVPDDQMLTLGQ